MSNSNDKPQNNSKANEYGSDLDITSMFDNPADDVDNAAADAVADDVAVSGTDAVGDEVELDFGTGDDVPTDSTDEHAIQFDNADSGLLDFYLGQPELTVDSGIDAAGDVGLQSPFDSPVESPFESPFETETTNQEAADNEAITDEATAPNDSEGIEIDNVMSGEVVAPSVDETDPKGKKKKAKREKPKKEPKTKKEKKPGDGKSIDWTLWSYRSASIAALAGTVIGIVYCSVLNPANGATFMYHLITALSIIAVGVSVAVVPFLFSSPSVVAKKKDNAEPFKMRYGEVMLGLSVVAMAIGLLALFIELYKYDFIIKP
ncbi:MAG: hypothetical protein LBU65_01770 [Planctomycetaceae bacterium]|jgi:hypothetical protein|nr:hypothetical protein [Planctomycetaceae bacterium]